MFAPNQSTYDLADRLHSERVAHSTRIRRAARERGPEGTPVNREAHRRVTARRLSAGLAGALLSIAVVAGALAMQAPAQEQPHHPAQGGGPVLIR